MSSKRFSEMTDGEVRALAGASPDLSSTLDEIRERHRQHVSVNFPAPGTCISRDGSWPCDASRLLDAVEAVLELHPPSIAADGEEICPSCGWDRDVSRVPADRCLIREAISRALLGAGGGDGAR